MNEKLPSKKIPGEWMDEDLDFQRKELFLSISQDLLAVRSKQDLLYFINQKLKRLLNFEHFNIALLSQDKQYYKAYVLDPDSITKKQPEYEEMIDTWEPVQNGIIDLALRSDQAVLVDLEEALILFPGLEHIRINHEAGIREIAVIRLENQEQNIGLFLLFSETKKVFNPYRLQLLREISNSLAIALSNILAREAVEQKEKETEYILSLNHQMADINSREELLKIINERLKKLVYFKYSTTIRFSADRKTFSMFLLDPESMNVGHKDYTKIITQEHPVNDKIFNLAIASANPLVIDIAKLIDQGEEHYPAYIRMFYESGIREVVGVPLKNNSEIFGMLLLFAEKINTFTRDKLNIIKGIADLISIGASHIIAKEEIRKGEKEKEALLAISHKMARIRDKNDLLTAINTELKKLFYFTHTSISAICKDRQHFSIYLTDPDSVSRKHAAFASLIKSSYPIHDGIFETFLTTDEPTVSDYEIAMLVPNTPLYVKIHYETGLREAVSIPLQGEKETWGVLHFYSDRKNSFTQNNVNIIRGVASQVAIAVSNILAHEELRDANNRIKEQLNRINEYKQQLEEENLYLQEEIVLSHNQGEILGSSPEMQKVFQLISQVAPTNSTVLILGETGTGKELIARAIHNASSRKGKLMVKVNCAALPPTLIESELFGHERGAFTGATEKRIGKFELANGSTLFLDEIGEIPIDLQSKLLRALQEKEIERVGGKGPIKVDVRIITATNRNLANEVELGKFRNDLYYRLNVFPIILPALRNRKDDIPMLISHFLARYAKNNGREILNVTQKVLQDLLSYHWPGNIRELEHMIERSVLLSKGPTIKEVHLPTRAKTDKQGIPAENRTRTIIENEREHVLAVLKKSNGKLSGRGGAAELLGVPYSTLTSKLKKLGIKKEHFFIETK